MIYLILDQTWIRYNIQYESINNRSIYDMQWAVVAVIVWWLDLQLPSQSVLITIDVVSSNLDQGEVIKWLVTGRWFSPGPPVSSTKWNWPPRYNWNIVESGAKHHQVNKQTYDMQLSLIPGCWITHVQLLKQTFDYINTNIWFSYTMIFVSFKS